MVHFWGVDAWERLGVVGGRVDYEGVFENRRYPRRGWDRVGKDAVDWVVLFSSDI